MATTKPVVGEYELDPSDPYRYGWRYVRQVDDHGQETWEQIPLTADDVLHPEEEDFIVQNEPHIRRCHYLYDVLCTQVAADPTTVVTFDLRIDWQVAGIRPHGPDLAVFSGVAARKPWTTFHLRDEGARPVLVIEVTSPTTVAHDRTTKRQHYARVGVPRYVLVDALVAGHEGVPQVIGYELVEGRYQELALDERGRLWLAPVQVWLGVADGELVCYDAADQPVGDYQTLAADLAAERQALAAERQALAAERQARQAADQQVEAERQARTDAEQRATVAEHQAQAEAAARAALEVHLREIEAELRRLHGEA